MGHPQFITFTGADDRTDIGAMKALAEDFPVEFGVLWSHKRRGWPRYPSPARIDKLRSQEGLNLSLHICGDDARSIAAGTDPGIDLSGFARAQINGISGATLDVDRVAAFAATNGVRGILQSGSRDCFPASTAVDWLFDLSGGRGEQQSAWPVAHPGRLAGYAGGLGLDASASFTAIDRAAGGAPYWIDMESKLRDEMDEFNIGQCRRICELVYGPDNLHRQPSSFEGRK